jgi:hypothetical protein
MAGAGASGGDRSTEIRRIRADEFEGLRRVRLAALAGDPDAFWSQHENEAVRPEEYWRSRAARGAASDTEPLWVAEGPAGGLIGLAALGSLSAVVPVLSV